MRTLLLLLVLLAPAFAGEAPAAVAEAAKRRTWSWFGLAEAAGQRLSVVWRDGAEVAGAATGVQTAVLAGLVVEARHPVSGEVEGCREAALVPLLGLPEAEATAAAKRLQRPVRVVWRDGQGLPATMDFCENRLNLHLAGGLVVAITGG